MDLISFFSEKQINKYIDELFFQSHSNTFNVIHVGKIRGMQLMRSHVFSQTDFGRIVDNAYIIGQLHCGLNGMVTVYVNETLEEKETVYHYLQPYGKSTETKNH